MGAGCIHCPGTRRSAPQRDLGPLAHASVGQPLRVDPYQLRAGTGRLDACAEQVTVRGVTVWGGDVECSAGSGVDQAEGEVGKITYVDRLDRLPRITCREHPPATRGPAEQCLKPAYVLVRAEHHA